MINSRKICLIFGFSGLFRRETLKNKIELSIALNVHLQLRRSIGGSRGGTGGGGGPDSPEKS